MASDGKWDERTREKMRAPFVMFAMEIYCDALQLLLRSEAGVFSNGP